MAAGEVRQAARKKFMYLHRRAPHGTNYGQEGLDAALVGAAFEQRVCIAFIDDGVFQLLRDQHTQALGVKNFAAAFAALGDYEVEKIWVERESLLERGLTTADLMPLAHADDNAKSAPSPLLEIIGQEDLADLIAQQDVLLNF